MKKIYYLCFTVTTIIVLFNSCEENQPPNCQITYPEDGTEFYIGETILITVDADDQDGNISEVRFYINDIGVSSSNNFPYSYNWDTSTEEDGIKTILVKAKDTEGSSTTDEISIILNAVRGKFTDSRDSHDYEWVKIGDQIWMAENLAYLPSVNLRTNGSYTDPLFYVYGYTGTNINEAKAINNYVTYGVLYNWPSAMEACPDGWHLPTDEEWETLIDYLGGTDVAGGKLKETGTTHWMSPNYGATNETGFTALPGGARNGNGYFNYVGGGGYWWGATEHGAYGAWSRSIGCSSASVGRYGYYGEYGFSVRCVRDD